MPFLDATIGWFLAQMADIIFNVVAWITAQVGHLLDFVIRELVLGMADMVNSIPAIDSLWQIFRDLGNIAFIGVLLYIAIRTILDIGNSFNTKQTLVRLVIVALLVNFSLFATKVVVDTSNVVALQFYNSIQVEGCEQADGCNISHFFADATNISSVQSAESIRHEEAVQASNSVEFRIFLVRVLGIIFLLTTAFVMGAMAFLLIIRFAFLVLLMIASPLAFIAFILPNSSFGKQWWDKLLSQSFFAPVMFAMLYVVANLAAELESGVAGGSTDLMAALLNPEGENIGVVLVFILMIVLMVATLIVAKQMGAAGAQKAISIGQKARSWGQTKVVGGTARMTIGKAGQFADKKLKKSRFAQSYYGDKFRQSTTKKAAEAKFGTGASAASIAKDKKEADARLGSFDERQNVRKEIEQATDDATKRRALNRLSSKEKIGFGKDFLKEHAELLSENDFKAIDNHDDFSERDKQEIKEAAVDTLKALKDPSRANPSTGDIKSFLATRSDDQIKNIDIELINQPEVIKNMSSDQFDTAIRGRIKSEQLSMKRNRLEDLNRAINNGNLQPYFADMKDKDIAKLLKIATDSTINDINNNPDLNPVRIDLRTNDQVVDELSISILEKLAEEGIKRGEKDTIKNAVDARYTQPGHAPTEKNSNAAGWINYGQGKSIYS